MFVHNAKHKQCAEVIEHEFKEVAKIPLSFSLDDVKKYI